MTLVPSPAPTRTAVFGAVTEPAAGDALSIVAEAVAVVQVVLEADLQKLEQIIIVVDYQLGFSTTQEAF